MQCFLKHIFFFLGKPRSYFVSRVKKPSAVAQKVCQDVMRDFMCIEVEEKA